MLLMSFTREKKQRVTVVTVTKDDPEGLEKTIASVVAQKSVDLEYIIINGSTYESISLVVEKYLDRIARIVSGKDNGIYDAMNIGLSYATCGWVNFMNSGDEFVDEYAVYESLAFPDTEKYSIVYTEIHESLDQQVFRSCFIFKNICQQTIFYNLNKLRSIMHFDDKMILSADFDLLLSIYYYDKLFFFRCVAGRFVRYSPGGVSGSDIELLFRERFKVLHKYRKNMGVLSYLINYCYARMTLLRLTKRR